MKLLDFEKRPAIVDELNELCIRLYQDIDQDTPVDQTEAVVIKNKHDLERLTDLDLSLDGVARAIGYQVREMLKADGTPILRGSGHVYPVHPITVAAITSFLAEKCGVADDIELSAVLLSLLHDVIEEGERVTNFDQIAEETGLSRELTMGIELLDHPPLTEPIPGSSLPMIHQFTASFGYRLAQVQDRHDLHLSKVADKFDWLLDTKYIQRKEPQTRATRLAISLANCRHLIDSILTINPVLSSCVETRDQLIANLQMEPRIAEITGMYEEPVRTKLAGMEELQRLNAGYLGTQLEQFCKERSIDMRGFF